MKNKFSRGVRRHIRKEKARIRREFHDPEERQRKIKELVANFSRAEAQSAG